MEELVSLIVRFIHNVGVSFLPDASYIAPENKTALVKFYEQV